MKVKFGFILLVMIGLVSYSCTGPSATPASTEAESVQDQAGFLAAMQKINVKAEVVDSVFQDFFTPEGSLIQINGIEVQVFEYETASDMEAEAAQVAPDGDSVGTSMMMWMDAPHFFKSGRILILYLGSDQSTLAILQQLIGSQFAGQ